MIAPLTPTAILFLRGPACPLAGFSFGPAARPGSDSNPARRTRGSTRVAPSPDQSQPKGPEAAGLGERLTLAAGKTRAGLAAGRQGYLSLACKSIDLEKRGNLPSLSLGGAMWVDYAGWEVAEQHRPRPSSRRSPSSAPTRLPGGPPRHCGLPGRATSPPALRRVPVGGLGLDVEPLGRTPRHRHGGFGAGPAWRR